MERVKNRQINKNKHRITMATNNFAEQLDLVEQQIHTLNEAQALYPVKNETITIQLVDTKLIRTFEVSDAWLDIFLDSIIVHQSLEDDYKVRVIVNEPFTDTDEDEDSTLVLDTCITRAGHDALKKALSEDKKNLQRIVRRPDPRLVKRPVKPALPSWAVLDDDAKSLPSQMYLGGSSDDMEDCILTGKEFPYRKIKVKNIPIQDVPIAHLDV